jgi:hypothetical protein
MSSESQPLVNRNTKLAAGQECVKGVRTSRDAAVISDALMGQQHGRPEIKRLQLALFPDPSSYNCSHYNERLPLLNSNPS